MTTPRPGPALAVLALAVPLLSGCLMGEPGWAPNAPPPLPPAMDDPSFAALPPDADEPEPQAFPQPPPPPRRVYPPPPPPPLREEPPPPPLREAPPPPPWTAPPPPAAARRCGSCGCTTREESIADFVRRADEHIRRFFRDFSARRDRAAMDAFIREGIRRAERHGIVNERDVVKYLDVWIVRGDGFEREPWAARVLADRRRTPTEKADALFRAAVE